MTPRLELPNGEVKDEIQQPVWDTYDLLGGISPLDTPIKEFFSDVQGKNATLTNLKLNNQFPRGVSFRTQGLVMYAMQIVSAAYAGLVTALPLIMQHSSLRLKVSDKIFWEGPMESVGGRIESDIAGLGTAASFQQLGAATGFPVRWSPFHVVNVAPGEDFRVQWETATMTAPEAVASTPAQATKLRFKLLLLGLQRRPVL